MNIVDFPDYISIVNEFNRLSEQTVFEKMFDLKDLYSGREIEELPF
jgi:hypothetical protein